MIVRVRLFALARDLAECELVELTAAEGATIGDVRRGLAEAYPQLASLLPHAMFAIAADYARDDAAVPYGADVACIPPVSGG